MVPSTLGSLPTRLPQDLSSLTAGATGYPPMFGGQKAFAPVAGSAPVCTAHPLYGD